MQRPINKLISIGMKHVKIYEMMQDEHNLKCSLRTLRSEASRARQDV